MMIQPPVGTWFTFTTVEVAEAEPLPSATNGLSGTNDWAPGAAQEPAYR